MKTIITLIIGFLLGAAVFHLYYLRQSPSARCAFDYPFNDQARSRCESDAAIVGYAKGARKQLNDLIDKVEN